MTETEQRIAIAEFCGWHTFGVWNGNPDQPAGYHPSVALRGVEVSMPLPNYTTDLNAMHAAVARLTRERYDDDDGFTYHLARVVHQHTDEAGWNFYELQEATATQRAEAFLKTIGKWSCPT